MEIRLKPFLYFSIAFMLFSIIGTLSHEYGHILFARYLDFEASLHYGSMDYDDAPYFQELKNIYENNKDLIQKGLTYEEKARYEKLLKRYEYESFLITLGGPLQSYLTGTIAFIILLWRKRIFRKTSFKIVDWILVFLSLFWLRAVFNLFMGFAHELNSPDGYYFTGDEVGISYYLDLWLGTVPIFCAITGLIICSFVVLNIVPNIHRWTFILAGLTGSILGYISWFKLLGPNLLP